MISEIFYRREKRILFKSEELMLKKTNIEDNQKALEDYYNFFTTKEGADILPYVYIEKPSAFDDLVKNCKDYYLFQDEVNLILENQDILSHYLTNISDIIEIGPGFTHSVEHKTLSILQAAKDLKNYYPIDIAKDYLINACNVVAKKFKHVQVHPIEANMLALSASNLHDKIPNHKALIFLGSTLCGQTSEEQSLIIRSIYEALSSGDLFILTVDTNNDADSLIKAYINNIDIIMASLEHFIRYMPGFKEHLDKFKPGCVWNAELKYIDQFFTAKENLTFYYPNYGMISIEKGQELRGIKSRKISEQETINLLIKEKFLILDIINGRNNMKIFICQKG